MSGVPALGPDTLAALRQVFAEANYTGAGLRGFWGMPTDQALERNNAAPAQWFVARALAGGEHGDAPRLAVLAQLFTLAGPVSAGLAEGALGTALAAELTAGGLLVSESGQTAAAGEALRTVRSSLTIRPYAVPVGVPRYDDRGRPASETLYLASDHGTLTHDGPVDGDFVLGVGGAGKTLVEITPRDPVDLAADIGCGCGIQALLLARHARHVIATDVSARALALTELGCGLNGVDNVETRLGSLFDPLDGPVDLLVSNPPFVITPQGATAALEYRDGGRPGDQLMREVLAGAPAQLREGGQAAFLGNWESDPLPWIAADGIGAAGVAADGDDTVGADAAGVDVMVIQRERLDPVAYAETWIRDGGVARATSRWRADTAAWLEDFRARDVAEIGFGWVRMERRDSGDGEAVAGRAPLRHLERLTGPLGANNAGLAAHLDTRLGLLQWLAETTDDELADAHFVRASDVTEHRHFTPGAEQPTMITLEQGTGFARTFDADPALAGFVGVADGELSLAQIAAALAQLLGVDANGLQAQLIDQARVLIPAGLLYPAG